MINSPRCRLLLVIMFMGGLITALWLRNRDILRDLADYSMVIAAAGKVEAGLKPYTDVPSPMQSAVYLLNAATECVFGRSYLGLTMGGLMQALGGGLMLLVLLRRSVSLTLLTVTCAAVVVAGPLQHAVFFYNPLGILCLAGVVLGLAVGPELKPVTSLRSAIVLGAIFLGGINKVNFQGVTLVLAAMISVAAWQKGTVRFAAVVRNGLWLFGAGVAAPLGFELLWTGATAGEWWQNVIQQPAQRRAYLENILETKMYLHPVHDFYPYVSIGCLGGIGLVLLLGMGGWMLMAAKRDTRPLADWIIRVALVACGALAGAAVMITNNETVVLTSLVYPIMAVALFILYRREVGSGDRWVGLVLSAGLLCWGVTGGYAAWMGSRILYGPNPPSRDHYVRLVPKYPALEYLRGVRLLPDQADALTIAARRLAEMEDVHGRLPPLLFGQGQEWFERYYVGNIVRGAPIWLQNGTTLNESDAGRFLRFMDGGRRRLLVQRGWQFWPDEIQQILRRDYMAESISGRDVLYHPRGPVLPAVAKLHPVEPAPFAFRAGTDSAVLLPATYASDDMGLFSAGSSEVYGADKSSNWSFTLGANELRGKAEVRLREGSASAGLVTFRILAGDTDNEPVLWEMPVLLGPDQLATAKVFAIQAGGRPFWLQVIVPPALKGEVIAGWRELRITGSNRNDQSPPAPFLDNLAGAIPQPLAGPGGAFSYPHQADGAGASGWRPVPAEYWRRGPTEGGMASATAEFEPLPAGEASFVVATLVWYRAGRYEFMAERRIDTNLTRNVTLSEPAPEPGGWVGLLLRGEARGARLAHEVGEAGK